MGKEGRIIRTGSMASACDVARPGRATISPQALEALSKPSDRERENALDEIFRDCDWVNEEPVDRSVFMPGPFGWRNPESLLAFDQDLSAMAVPVLDAEKESHTIDSD